MAVMTVLACEESGQPGSAGEQGNGAPPNALNFPCRQNAPCATEAVALTNGWALS